MIDLEEHVQETQRHMDQATDLGVFLAAIAKGMLEILEHASHEDCELAEIANSDTFTEEAELSRAAAQGIADVIKFLASRRAKLLETQQMMSEEH